MKTNTKAFAVGLLVVGLIECVGSTTIATPVSQSGSPKSQPRENETPAKNTAFRVVGNAPTALTWSEGVSWNTLGTQGETNFRGLNWAKGNFVTVGSSKVIRTSIDGVTWTRSHSGIASQLWSATDTDDEPALQLFSCYIRPNLLATAQPPIIGEINP